MHYKQIVDLENSELAKRPYLAGATFVQLFNDENVYNRMLAGLLREFRNDWEHNSKYSNELKDAPVVHGFECQGRISKTFCYTPINIKENI